MTTYCIPPEELPKAVRTLGQIRFGSIRRDDGMWDMYYVWSEKNQAVDVLCKKREEWWIVKRFLKWGIALSGKSL